MSIEKNRAAGSFPRKIDLINVELGESGLTPPSPFPPCVSIFAFHEHNKSDFTSADGDSPLDNVIPNGNSRRVAFNVDFHAVLLLSLSLSLFPATVS